MSGRNVFKFVAIVLAGAVFAVVLHQVHHDPLMTLQTKSRSVVVTSGYFPPVAFASLVAAFGIMGAMFLALQKSLYGTRVTKGALFGIALGGMYFIGMLEAYVVYPVPLLGEVFTGAVDASGILLMSVLLGRYLAADAPDGDSPRAPLLPAVLIIAAAYVLTRYFSYAVLHIESSSSTRPLATFLWTAAMGCWVGVMYPLIGRGLLPGSPFKRALAFGGGVFGVNWLVFNLFALLFISVPLSDLLCRSMLDALAIIAAVYLASFFAAAR